MSETPGRALLPLGAEPAVRALSRNLTNRRDEIVAQAVREHDARLERRARGSRTAAGLVLASLGLAVGWVLFSYAFVWQ
jgi:hypothetical protein